MGEVTIDENCNINYKERIIDKSNDLEKAVNNIVEFHTKELTAHINSIRAMLKDETDILTDQEIEDIMLRLPIILYDKTDDQELVGLQSDYANQIYKEAYNEAYKLARGTVADKTSVAELNTMTNKLDQIIFDRAYKIIKQKINMAMETLNAVKKVQSMRQDRENLGRFSNRF